MPRKGYIAKRDVLADPIYNSKLVTRLINKLMVDGLPVIFLKKIIKAKYIKSIRLSTVSGSSIIGIYKADVYINNSYIDCYIAFGKQEYDCLLNINMINRLEGIKNV